MNERAPRRATCPGCNKPRDVDTQRGLLAAERVWVERRPSLMGRATERDTMRRLASSQRRNWYWACDPCLESGSAVAADPTRVNIGMGTPFPAYIDRPFRCTDCDAHAVFAAREQKTWFEQYGFLIWVYPKQCLACRRARREKKASQKELMAQLAELDPTDASQLRAVASLYESMGCPDKAALYRRRAANRDAPEA